MSILQNGSHPDQHPDYFEWWYFHLLTNEGWFVNLILHTTDIFAVNRKSYVSMSILSPSGRPYYFRKEFGEQQICPNSDFLSVKLDGCALRESDTEIVVDISLDEASLQATIQKVGNPLIIQDGVLFQDKQTGLKNYWFVPVPHAPFKAELHIYSMSEYLTGYAYHDHNWGNAKIQDFFSSWLWGHLRFPMGFLVYYYIKTIQGIPIARALISLHNHSDILENLFVAPITTEQYFWGQKLPAKYEIYMQNPYSEPKVSVSVDRLFRKREDFGYCDFIPIYYRASCSAQFQSGATRFDGDGIAEYLYIERGGKNE